MSGSSVQVDSTSISTMLLALMVICIVVYGYIEFKRVHSRLNAMEEFTSRIMNLLKNGPPESRPTNVSSTQSVGEVSDVKDSEEKDTEVKETAVKETEAKETEAKGSVAKETIVKESFVNPVEEEDVDEGDIEAPAEPPRFEDPLLQVNPERIVDLGEDIQQAQEPIEIEFNFMNKIDDEGDDEGGDEDDTEDNPLIPKSPPENDIANLGDIEESLTHSQLEEYTIRQLKDVLTSMSLPTSGNKASLIKRILANQTTK